MTETLRRPAEEELAAPAAASPAIHTVDLAKVYKSTLALAGLTMRVPRGEIFGFLGPNGAGKTTAVKLLTGLIRPTSGEAMVLGARAGDLATRRRIGYLPELFRYQDWLSGREVLALHAELARLPRSDWPELIDTALHTVGLTGREGDRVATYSKGMQQRLGLAVALLGRPELVFLDEPTSALDPVGRHEVREVIRQLRSRGVTIFLNSHMLSEVEQVCDRVAIVDKGRVVAIGTLPELLREDQVRIQVAGLQEAQLAALSRFGKMGREQDWITFSGLTSDRVPELVQAIVALGGLIYAVEPRRQNLEERFLQLLEIPAS